LQANRRKTKALRANGKATFNIKDRLGHTGRTEVKNLTTGEKRALIDYHARCILQEFGGIQSPQRDSVVEHLEKLSQLIKAFPKSEYGTPR
jgi:hypothetical protein